MVIRYIDLMESSIAQSLHKGFQKENWSPVRWVNLVAVNNRNDKIRRRQRRQEGQEIAFWTTGCRHRHQILRSLMVELTIFKSKYVYGKRQIQVENFEKYEKKQIKTAQNNSYG